MREIRRNEIKNIVNTSICILLVILIVLVLAILYKYFTYKKEVQASLEVSANVEELYNTTNAEQTDKKEKDIDSNTSDWELLLVNKEHKIPEGYSVELEEVETTHKIDKRVAEALKQMLSDARKEGLSPIICSSYRTSKKTNTVI